VLLDCDTHFSDHFPELWAELGQELSVPQVPEVTEVNGELRLRIGDRMFPKPTGPGRGNPRGLGLLQHPGRDDDRQVFMADQGIGVAVLQPGFVGLSVPGIADPVARTALAAAYNVLAARSCARSSVQLRWVVLLSVEDPDWSLEQIRSYLTDPHLVGAGVRPTGRTEGVRLSDPRFTAVLELLAAEQLPLFLHGGTGLYQWSPLAEGYQDYAMTHAFGHMGEHMIALTDLLTRPDGIPAGCKIVMLEGGVSWLPSVLQRLESHIRRLSGGGSTPQVAFHEHFGLVPDPGERYALWACRELGAESILFGSDYPHWDMVDSREWQDRFAPLCPPESLEANTRRLVPRLAATS